MTAREVLLRQLLGELASARELSVKAGLDHHFVSDLDHLASTALANADEEAAIGEVG